MPRKKPSDISESIVTMVARESGVRLLGRRRPHKSPSRASPRMKTEQHLRGTHFPYHALRIGKMFTTIEFKCPIFQCTESGTYDAAPLAPVLIATSLVSGG